MLTNTALTVSVEPAGTLRLTTASGVELTDVGRLVDGGDRGDTYNCAPPARDEEVFEPTSVDVTLLESGPLRGRLEVIRCYSWPIGLAADLDARTAETATACTRTVVELRSGEPFVRLNVDVDNPSRDHRLRLHVPTVRPATESAAGVAVKRSAGHRTGTFSDRLPT